MSDNEATRLGFVGAVLRPPALGIVAASAIARNEAAPTQSPTTSKPVPPVVRASGSSTSQINLSWSETPGAASYNVNRGSTSGSETAVLTKWNQTNYSDAGLNTATTYYYVVDAVDSKGNVIVSSAEASATTLASIGPPPPILPVVKPTASSNVQINLAWSQTRDAASYNVNRGTLAGGPKTTVASGWTGTVYSDVGLDNTKTYYYVVDAVDASGKIIVSSVEVSATPLPTVVTPVAPQLQASASSTSQINLTWTPTPGAASYNVNRGPASGAEKRVLSAWTDTDYSDGGLRPDSTHFYIVDAVDAGGTVIVRSNEVSAKTWETMKWLPLVVKATGLSTGQINLAWNHTPGAATYNVHRGTTAGGDKKVVASVRRDTSHSDEGLDSNTTYYYIVEAVDVNGKIIAAAAEFSATPLAATKAKSARAGG